MVTPWQENLTEMCCMGMLMFLSVDSSGATDRLSGMRVRHTVMYGRWMSLLLQCEMMAQM